MQYVVPSKVVSIQAEAATGVLTENADAAWLPI